MSDPNTAVPKGKDERLATMRGRLTMAMAAYSDSRNEELDDLRFLAGSPDNQWQWRAAVLATRASDGGQPARPTITINKLPQHVHQVTNDQRQNRPAGKVIPADDSANAKVAEVLQGMVRHIEYISDADVAYDTACDNQVAYGEGYVRLLTKYTRPDSFEQDIYIGRVRNSFGVYMDPTIQDPCGSDAEWCFIMCDMTKEEYERQYPDAMPVSAILDEGVGDASTSEWLDAETVRIAEYFYFEHKDATLNLYAGGETAFSDSPENDQLKAVYGEPVKTRKADRKKVKWIKTNGYEVLEEQDWAGKYIPVVRVIGNEYEVDGQLYISGLVRNAKDAQRMYNYWVSQEAEMLALAPKAPFIGAGGQFEGYENQWKTANSVNWPYLEYNPDVSDGMGGRVPPPQRAIPPMPQSGILQAKLGAGDDIKSATGQYDSSLGAAGNETSGKAIIARERQGDVGTFHYSDNLGRAVRYVTRQIIDLIPHIYDTQRVARIIGYDGKVGKAKIDPNQQEPLREVRDDKGALIEEIYNPGVGTYDVMVTSGPGYMTKRQEMLDAMTHILQAKPDLWNVAGDLFFKEMDFEGAQELSDRMKAVIDPRVLKAEESPGLQAAQKQIQEMTQILQVATNEIQQLEDGQKAKELEIKEYEAETHRMAVLIKQTPPEELQAVILQTIHEMMTNGELPIPPAGGHDAPMSGPQMQQPMPEAEPPEPMAHEMSEQGGELDAMPQLQPPQMPEPM